MLDDDVTSIFFLICILGNAFPIDWIFFGDDDIIRGSSGFYYAS